jgi:hypothetical protein
MSACLRTFYEAPCNYGQNFFNSYIPEIPEDFVRTAAKNFVYSFAVSVFFSAGNPPLSGLKGGALAVIATTMHVTCITLLKKLGVYLSSYSGRSNRQIDIDSDGIRYAMLLSLAGTLYLGHTLSLALSNKATFFATIPFVLFALHNKNTPIFGIVILSS